MGGVEAAAGEGQTTFHQFLMFIIEAGSNEESFDHEESGVAEQVSSTLQFVLQVQMQLKGFHHRL